MSILRIRDENGNVQEVLALRGPKGEDAYAKAVENGFEGTEEAFYLSLAQLQESLNGKLDLTGGKLTGELQLDLGKKYKVVLTANGIPKAGSLVKPGHVGYPDKPTSYFGVTSSGRFYIQLPDIPIEGTDNYYRNAYFTFRDDGMWFGKQLPEGAGTTFAEFLRTDNVIEWAITNMDTWKPFFNSFRIGRVQQYNYSGTGVYGEANKKTVTFDFQPKLIIVKKKDYLATNSDGSEKVTEFNETMMMAFYGSPSAVSSRYFGTGTVFSYQTHLSWNGKSVSWWGQSETRHLNVKNSSYHVLAIG
jgi:hypothetical protein